MNTIFHEMSIPEYMQESLRQYVENHVPVGGFLEAVICNNLSESVARADIRNIRNIPAYANWLYNHAPSSCWGSVEKYDKWIKVN